MTDTAEEPDFLKKAANDADKIVKIENDTLIFIEQNYEVPLLECNTHKGILRWIEQLLPKDWVTKKHIRLLISHALSKFPNLNPHE